MTLLVYAITADSPSAAVLGDGVAGSPVSAIGAHGLAAIVSHHEAAPVSTEAALWSFERVVEARMVDGPVIPARFGSLLEDVPAVRRLLRDRRAELTAKLEYIGDAVELGVRASWLIAETDPMPTGADAGVSYMRDRVARDQAARGLAAGLEVALGDLVRAHRYWVLTRPSAPVTASYLVDRSHVDEFVKRVQDLATVTANTELVCTGPWPPYSFVGRGGDD